MKRTILIFLGIFLLCNLYSQEVEKVGEREEIKYVLGVAGGPSSPNEVYVDEVNNLMKIENQSSEYTYFDLLTLKGIKRDEYNDAFALVQQEIGNYEISYASSVLRIMKKGKEVKYIAGKSNISSGISFILKKDEGYIVYYVDEIGTPGAVDTEGRIYSNTEAIAYLKEYDPEKYAESLARAEELGLKADFERTGVLIWGKTYYTTTKEIESFYKDKDPYIVNGMIQYDNNGYGYQMTFRYNDMESKLCIVNPRTEREKIILIKDYSNILSTYEDGAKRKYFSASWYVGYGGNIYYYIAGEEYTEVFRIRRTWGNPDMYAMAINGYTEDNYGKYVTETLSAMSKSDLRLLRNTIFALYGVHFKSEDLSKHFAKEVWYTDEGKTSGDVTLPAHRQKLVEMIQAMERK